MPSTNPKMFKTLDARYSLTLHTTKLKKNID